MCKKRYTIYINYITLFFGFLLGSLDGKIALWQDADPTPHIFPYAVTSLPLADQQALERGIYIEEEGQLRDLLQDYLS